MAVRPFPSKSAKKDQDEGDVTVAKFDKNASAVEVILLVHWIYEVMHSLWTINMRNREDLKSQMQTHDFKYICGLVVVIARQLDASSGEETTEMFVGTRHGNSNARQNL